MTSRSPVLEPPTQCDLCKSKNIIFTDNEIIYGLNIGDWPKCYYCKNCSAIVGCHKGTNLPLGFMASKQTRKLRSKLHIIFDKLWLEKLMSRSQAYNWLARQLDIKEEHCHISWMNKETLAKAIDLVSLYYEENREALLRRKIKRDLKFIKERNDRTNQRKSNRERNRIKSTGGESNSF